MLWFSFGCGSVSEPQDGNVDVSQGTLFLVNQSPTLVISDCGDPSPINGIAVTPKGTTYGEEAIIRCNLGYKLEDLHAVHIFCLDGPVWSYTPVCNKIVCQDPTPVNGSTTDTVFTYGTTVTITCDDGYTIDGSPTIICQDDGIWNDTATCHHSDCGHPSPSHGTFVAASGTLSGSSATVSCNAGYTLNGSSTVTCTGSRWDTHPTCDIKDCGPLSDLANGIVDDGEGTQFGAIITYSCDYGYDLVGGAKSICTQYGNWSKAEPPICVIKDCGPLARPLHGSVNVSQGTKFGNSASYTCDVGYNLSGNEKRDCNQYGNWSGTSPSCIFIDCGLLPHPHDGSVDISDGTHYGDSATYSCIVGYSLSSDVTRNCRQDGNWSGTAPVCVIKDCGSVPSILNGRIDLDVVSNTKYNATATVNCNGDYKTKFKKIVCQDTGTWEKSTCTPKDRSMSLTVLVPIIIGVVALVLLLVAIYIYIKFKRERSRKAVSGSSQCLSGCFTIHPSPDYQQDLELINIQNK